MRIENILEKLTPREEKVVKMIIDRKSLTEIAAHFEVSLERIGQIVAKSVRKIAFIIKKDDANNQS